MTEKTFIVRAEKAFEFKDSLSQPWNTDTIIPATQLERLTGLTRSRVHLLRVPAGQEGSEYHSHQCEEEWIYVLRGQGMIEIDDTEYVLGPGDFVGFPAGGPPHQLSNPFKRSLVCLIGGERKDVDIEDFPRVGRRLFRHGDTVEVYDPTDAEEQAPADLDEIVMTNYRRSLVKD